MIILGVILALLLYIVLLSWFAWRTHKSFKKELQKLLDLDKELMNDLRANAKASREAVEVAEQTLALLEELKRRGE